MTRRPFSSTSSSPASGSTLRPAPSAITSTSPGTRPTWSRNGFGITNLPALSMVVFMPIGYQARGGPPADAIHPVPSAPEQKMAEPIEAVNEHGGLVPPEADAPGP